MPGMPRTSKKATKIARNVLGAPANEDSRRKRSRKSETVEMVEVQETQRYMR